MIDIAANRMSAARLASFEPSLGGPARWRSPAAFDWRDAEPEPGRPAAAAWEASPRLKEEEFTRAVALGLFDYLRKSRSRGFVVSLSGGADSSAVSCLVALMVEMACGELGAAEFQQSAEARGGAGGRRNASQPRAPPLALRLPGRRRQQRRRDAAGGGNRWPGPSGPKCHAWTSTTWSTGYVGRIEQVLGRQLTWETDDLALQNIQARVRGPSVWLLANVNNALLLSTSNRSEAAVGYATMDGDTCGGLCPIAGIDKAFLLDWLRWLETAGPEGLHPIAALSVVTRQQPTAELRPPSAGQTDEDDLMPYRVLDAIERAAIRDKQSPREVFRLVRPQFPQYSPAQLHLWVERFFRLWCRNQWKRERYAPSFHLDDENLDPKTWCRFPILSGGFERELKELKEGGQARERCWPRLFRPSSIMAAAAASCPPACSKLP